MCAGQIEMNNKVSELVQPHVEACYMYKYFFKTIYSIVSSQ